MNRVRILFDPGDGGPPRIVPVWSSAPGGYLWIVWLGAYVRVRKARNTDIYRPAPES